MFANPETLATILHAGFLRKYGVEAYEWEPSTWWLSIKDDFGVDVPQNNKDKLSAVITAVTTDHFYSHFEAFEKICWALNDDDPMFGILTPLMPEEAAWGVVEVALNDTPEDFSAEVKGYLRSVLTTNGFYRCPPELSFCGLDIDTSFYETDDNEMKLKLLRVETYLRTQRAKLEEQLARYFPGVDPSSAFSSVLASPSKSDSSTGASTD